MEIEKLLIDLKVLKKGHFLLNSGLHSEYYFEKFRILENPSATTKLCGIIVDHFKGLDIDWVIGPTTGGVIIAFEVARQLNRYAGFAEERAGKRIVGRGFDIKDRNVLVVDDVLTTGKSIQETLNAVELKHGKVVGVGVLVDRSNQKMGFEYFATYRKAVENFEPDNCPLCKQGISLTKPGGV
ncbi:orotate phosphoribosyltransferase [candidate division WOR-3 bacterium 4484_100]|uniref:Orotate phosphoribosyltransferase n=1 Tax=candidate division WOR-3 bacterium 4484_100 TaxID=1936077 RepID=A0A1V4QFD1_UNCW3|nr:MAG: orotate phosphoribosyltransferase [candidate division WOR-3 bacterium 4484_100]